jgi:phenylpropionate dioxygenase-like ring-hydroxylating dioxygenase large terminal subunit
MPLYPVHDDLTLDIGDGPLEPDAAMMKTGRVPVDVYTSQERFEREREIFGRVWLYVGRVEEIANAGEWFVKDVALLSASALIVRGKDMKIRAFHNICSHRGMKLVWDRQGRGGKFSCPYHAWLYDAEGALANIPDAACFPHVDQKQSGLTPIACEVYEGFIFINFSPRQSLVEFLGPVAERLRDAPFGDFLFTSRVADLLDANWKFGHEASSEGYHVQVLHKNTARPMLVYPGNPHVHYADWKPIGAHRNMAVDLNPEFKLNPKTPVQSFSFAQSAGMVVQSDDGGAGSERNFRDHHGFNHHQSALWASEQFNLFPNFNIHVALNGWWSMSYWPIAPGKALWESRYYFRASKSTRDVFAAHYSLALNRDTVVEDNLCLAQQQAAMHSGAKSFIQFGEQEICCTHFAAVWEATAGEKSVEYRQAAE